MKDNLIDLNWVSDESRKEQFFIDLSNDVNEIKKQVALLIETTQLLANQTHGENQLVETEKSLERCESRIAEARIFDEKSTETESDENAFDPLTPIIGKILKFLDFSINLILICRRFRRNCNDNNSYLHSDIDLNRNRFGRR